MARPAPLLLAILALASLAWRGAATRLDEQQQQQQQQPAAGAAGFGRRLLAVKAGRGGAGGVVRPGMALHEATAARLCVMQCMQHACISWHKIYMGEAAGGSSMQPASAVPAAAAECMLQCGMPEVESGCLAQTYQRLLNTSPLQFSCSSSCVTGLLHSSCGQCSGTGGGCSALQLATSVVEAECLVDAAV